MNLITCVVGAGASSGLLFGWRAPVVTCVRVEFCAHDVRASCFSETR